MGYPKMILGIDMNWTTIFKKSSWAQKQPNLLWTIMNSFETCLGDPFKAFKSQLPLEVPIPLSISLDANCHNDEIDLDWDFHGMFHGGEMEMQNVVNHGFNHFIYKVCFTFEIPKQITSCRTKGHGKMHGITSWVERTFAQYGVKG